jgi:hypothetical protein
VKLRLRKKVSAVEISAAKSRVARWFCFQTKNPNLGKFWRTLVWKKMDLFYDHWEYFTDIRDIL